MVKIYKQPFAHGGDAIAIPDTSQPDGKMSSADGWTPDYQLPKTDPNYRPVGRQEMNGVFKEVTEALGQVQVQGTASWSPDGAPYPINAQVYHNGKQWLALRANSVAPVEGADWSAIVTDKQLATKAALSHTHTWSQVTDKPAQATRWPSLAEVTGLTTALAAKADTSTQVIAGTGLTGGGNLSSNRTLSLAASHTPIGVGQTWKNMKASRTTNTKTTYTNTTGRTIFIYVVFSDTSSEGLEVMLNGVRLFKSNDLGAYRYHPVCIPIPAGGTYMIYNGAEGGGGDTQILCWWELR